MKRIVYGLLLVSALLGMVSVYSEDSGEKPPYDKTITDAQALDIAEAIFRYQFETSGITKKDNVTVYISLFQKDPSDEFLARFKGDKPKVRKKSENIKEKGKDFSFVRRIERINDTSVVGYGGDYYGDLGAEFYKYNLEFKDGKWIVTSDKLEGIS